MMYPRILPLLAIVLSLPLVAAPNGDGIQWEDVHRSTAVEVIEKLEQRHYSQRQFGDKLSGIMFDTYLDRLDGNRLFFLHSDIEEFERYRYELDDTLRDGELKPASVMFQRYQQRLQQRMDWLLEALPEMVENFDFAHDESIQLDRAEMPWPADEAAAQELWRKRVKHRVLGLRLAGKPDDEIVPLLEKGFRNQLRRIQQSTAEDVFQLYINTLTELYDPHTNYFSPRTSENFNINMSLKLEGIGAVLQMEDQYTKVVRLVPAGPADKHGELRPADRIVAVAEGEDGELQDVIGWRLDDVVDLIRGPKDSIVRLEVIPAGAKTDERRKEIQITRNEVKLEEQSAQKEVIEIWHDERSVKVGVISIPTFYIDFEARRRGDPNYKSTTRDVYRLLTELMEEGVEGVVIDLRDNGGGSLQEAHALTGLFIDAGPIVQIRHANAQVRREGKTRSTPYYDGPLAVMINRLSASASEIFAGAMQDYHRALIIGSQSFGKGTVQSLTPLDHGQLKLTESKFYRISGDSTQSRGIIPDITLPGLYDEEEIGESALPHALPWDRIKKVPHRRYFDISTYVPHLAAQHRERIAEDPDFNFLTQQLSLEQETDEIERLSLNLQTRQERLDQQEAQRLALENQRRAAKGLEPVDSLDETPASLLPENAASGSGAGGAEEEDPEQDLLLNETAHILADSLPLYQRPLIAAEER